MSPYVVVDRLQPHAELFYQTKGLLGVVGVMLLIWHMTIAWPLITTLAQRLRYLALLYLGSLLAAASVEQIHDHADVSLRNVGAMGGTLVLIAAMVASLYRDFRHQPVSD